MNVKINTLPKEKEDLKTNERVEKIILNRNEVIAKKLGVEPKDIEVDLYYATHKLISKVGASDERLGVFSGYVDHEDKVLLAHPLAIEPIFSDNLYKQIDIMVDYILIKFYLCKIFYPERQDFKLYYKYLTDALAKVLSGNFNQKTVEFDIRHYSDMKKYKKDLEILMAFFVIVEKSEISMIYDNIELFYKDRDIKKSIMTIYKKEFKELVGLYQKGMIETEKALKKVR